MRPLLELHDVFELVFDEVLPATAGAAVTVISAIEARRNGFMALVAEFTSEKHAGPTRVPR